MNINFLIYATILIAPFGGFIIATFALKNQSLKKMVNVLFIVVPFLFFISKITKITFTDLYLNFIIVCVFYIGIIYALWLFILSGKRIMAVMASLLATFIFIASFVGFFAFGLAAVYFVPYDKVYLDDNFVYIKKKLGMATSDYFSETVEIYKRIGFLPLEKRIDRKVYFNKEVKLIEYDKDSKTLYLKLEGIDGSVKLDTIKVY